MSKGAADLVTVEEAAELAGVEPEQLLAMVDQGLLTAAEGSGASARFRRGEVTAVRQAGG